MKAEKILLAHGGGGKLTKELIDNLIVKKLSNPILNQLHDSALLKLKKCEIAFTTDSYTIKPIFFNGGDIGKLSVFGTVNDLVVAGAQPLYITLALVIEEGFQLELLEKIINSIKSATREAKVSVVSGDIKVVEKGAVEQIFINTSGIGILNAGINISSSRIDSGDKIIVNGFIGEHGISILALREGIKFATTIKSDLAPLSKLISKIPKQYYPDIHFMRDPTRGGIAMTLNEIAISSNLGIEIYEEKIPIRKEVSAACDMLGLDVLSVANEGKVVMIVSADVADKILSEMKKHPLGKNANIIGEIVNTHKGMVVMHTCVGGSRIITMPYGEELPRIC